MNSLVSPNPKVARSIHLAEIAALSPFDHLWSAPWDTIKNLEILPGVPLQADVFIVPEEWAHTRVGRKRYCRTVDLRQALPATIDPASPQGESLLRRAKRLAAILLLTPVVFPKGNVHQPSKPRTWVTECKGILRAMAWIATSKKVVAAETACPDGGPVFHLLTKADIDHLRQAGGFTSFWKHGAPKLAALTRMGVIDDWPDLDLAVQRERRRRGAAIPRSVSPDKSQWRPFSDEFTARIGKVSLWLVETLGPSIIACLEAAWSASGEGCDDVVNARRRAAIEHWTAEFFKGPHQFPLTLRVTGVGPRAADLTAWPPQNWRSLRSLARLLQTAHLVLIALATAARDSELTALPRDCLSSVGTQDLLLGYTFKLSDEPEGETRNWPLPKVAVAAIRQQQALANLLAPHGNSLWISFQKHGDDDREFPDLLSFGNVLKRFGTSVIVDGRPLTHWCQDGNVHPHRFRKTVARLAALSLVGATSIMFDILGHRDPEMTLNYILSDPGLQDEIRKIASEANMVLAKQALERSHENGGPAARAVADLKQRLAARSGGDELGIDSLGEAAEILSLNGQVAMVRPGVLCTKTLGQRGPCTRTAGLPDVGNCSTTCLHRLEHAAATDDCSKAIDRILADMPPPENVLMHGWWQAQLVGQLLRFPEIRQRYMTQERTQHALAGIDAATLARLTGPSTATDAENAA